MSKRKTSRKNDASQKTARSTKSSSFWNNAGQNPIPAVNIDRPFDFDVGFPHLTAKGFGPFYTGSAQYVTTTLSVPDDWCDCAAFDLSVQRLYQTIRENLRSNLSYTVTELKAYLASVTWLQAICSSINRDFAFLKFRDAQHPTFEHIWGSYAEYSQSTGNVRNALSYGKAKSKTYLADADMATSLTYIDNVLVPKMKLLLLPPVASEFCRWLFDSIFVDELNPARAQWYWNEISSIPMYEFDTNTNSLIVAHRMSTYTMQLSDLADYATYLASTYGVILADLRRCGARMVEPYIETQASRSPIMKYDDTFFYALRNGYTSGWEPTSGSENPEFFLVDFYEGMTSDQMDNALCLAGGISDNTELVRPIVIQYQSALVETDHSMKIVLGPFQELPVTGDCFYTSDEAPGIYYYSWITGATTNEVVSNGNNYELTRSITANSSVYGFTAGSMNYVLDDKFYGSPDSFVSAGVAAHIGTCQQLNNDTVEPIYFNIPANNITKTVDNAGVKAYTFSTNMTIVKVGSNLNLLTNGATTVNGSILAEKIWNVSSYPPVDCWKLTINITFATSGTSYTAQVSRRNITLNGTVALGEASSDVIVTMDPTKQVFDWLMQEVDHHIPIRRTISKVNTTTASTLYAVKTLLKETKVSTLYTREELSALLYSLDLSLFMVHGNTRIGAKQA